jgi:hypothetical protein
MGLFTICVLTFGDHLDQVRRTLASIADAIPSSAGLVGEIRICLNDCTPGVREWVERWSKQMAVRQRVASTHFVTSHNQFKYPLMRKMFREPEPIGTPFVMWFDDDSYLDPVDVKWWDAVHAAAAAHDIIGQFWLMPIQGKQWNWIKSQSWYNPRVGLPKQIRHRGKMTSAFEFCQGAWWVAKTNILLKYDWPLAEIRHNGGDSMLGELCRHQGLRMGRFHGKVHINADAQGRHSKSRRRGHSENRVGWDYAGRPLEREAHHQFDLATVRFPVPEIEVL